MSDIVDRQLDGTLPLIGAWVRFTGQYDWHGKQKHGMTGVIRTLTDYPPQVLAGVAEYLGTFRTGERAFGIDVPLWVEELEVIDPPD